MGVRLPVGDIVFDSEKAMRLATEGEEGVRLVLGRRDNGLRFNLVEVGRPSARPRVQLDFDPMITEIHGVELRNAEGALVYRDERRGRLAHGYPREWINVRLTPEGFVTNQVTFIEVEMTPKFPEGLFEFSPPESYSVYDGDRMTRNLMFGGKRLPMDQVVSVRSDPSAEASAGRIWAQRKTWLARGLYLLCLGIGGISLLRFVWRRSAG